MSTTSVFDTIQLPVAPAAESALSHDDTLALLARARAEVNRRRWLADPATWAREKFGITLWSAQVAIMESVRDYRKTAVQSCHEIGKSFSAALVAAWWIDCHKLGDAFVVTSAPTAPQVKTILWREIGRLHARGELPGRTNQTEWILNIAGKEEQVAIGRKPDEYNPTAFLGIHAAYVLVILDEACGIGSSLREAADSLTANDTSKLLEIGNPDLPKTEFHKNCMPGSGYHVITISAFDSPNFTGEPMPKAVLRQLIGRRYVEEKRKKWAPSWVWVDQDGKPSDSTHGVRVVCPEGEDPKATHPFWQSKVLGLFPEHAEDGNLIPLSWLLAAQARVLLPSTPSELGVDVGAGGDSSCIAHHQGPVVRIVHEDHNPDTMRTCGVVVKLLEKLEATKAKVDEIGIGKGIADRGKELKKPFVGVNVGSAASDPEHFINLRAELFWNLRERFEHGEIDLDPLDEDTAGELLEIRYKRLSSGKIQIESKEEMKKRKVPSPNRAEAVMLSFANPVAEGGELAGKATW